MSRKSQQMSSSKPYMIRAVYDWLLENDQTPYILIDAMQSGVEVPLEFVNDGKIVLNISPIASQNLHLGNSNIAFDARFGGIPMHVFAPVSAVMAIYSKENGRGMVFSEEEDWEDNNHNGNGDHGGSTQGFGESKPKRPRGKPQLKVIK